MSVRAFIAKQLLSLSLSQVRSAADSTTQAVMWHNQLHRLGLSLPLVVVHDLGLLLSTSASHLRFGQETPPLPAFREVAEKYRSLLQTLAAIEPIEQIAALRPNDKLIAVLLYKLLGSLAPLLPSFDATSAELPSEGFDATSLLLSPLDRNRETQRQVAFLRELLNSSVALTIRAELLDAQAVRLLSLHDGSTGLLSQASDNRIDLLELLAMFEADDLRDTVRFSLDLLPSVLEAQHVSGAQSYPTGGYAGLLHRGSLDALLPSELASDDELFYARFAQSELLYLGRERQVEAPHPLSYILVDCSPSMRGLRQVFARGLALSLCQRMIHAHVPVQLRFFDGRLHDAVRADLSPQRILPYILGFRSTRGRNYGRVFRDLRREVQALCKSNKTRVTIYLITHAECHIPLETVAALRQLAVCNAIFVRPSAGLHLDYLPLLHRYHVVSDEALRAEPDRKKQALDIISHVAETDS